MKKISFYITAIAFALMSLYSAQAQPEQTKKGPYVTNKFWDNWFVSAGIGAQDYFGENFRKGGTWKQITPAFDLSVGKWILPTIGVRGQLAGLQAKSYSLDANNPFVDGTSAGYYVLKMNYLHYHVDAMFNLSAAIGGYKENRVYEVIPYIGFGGISATNETSNELAFNGGIFNKFRLSNRLDINIDIKGALFNQSFDSQVGGCKGEGIGSVTVGLTYKISNKPFKRASQLTKEDLSPFNNRIKSLENDLADAKAKQKQLEDELAAAKNKAPETVVESANIAPVSVFFQIGQTTLNEKDRINLDNLAKSVKESNDHKIIITGYADKQTGSAARNMYLSKQRAQNVYDYLLKQGVDASQMEMVAKGSEVNPYSKPYLNRVVIVSE